MKTYYYFILIIEKEKKLKAARKNYYLTYKGRPIRITSAFLMETLDCKRPHML